MRNARVAIVAALLTLLCSAAPGAAENPRMTLDLEASFGGRVEAGSVIESDLWMEGVLWIDALGFLSRTTLNVLPDIEAVHRLALRYAWLELGAEAFLDLDPLGFQSIWAVLEASSLEMELLPSDPAVGLAVAALVRARLHPTFTGQLEVDLGVTLDRFSLRSRSALGFAPFSIASFLEPEIRYLDVRLGTDDAPRLLGDLGSRIDLFPGLDGSLWLEIALAFEQASLTSRTEFDYAPFGFSSQLLRFDLVLIGWSAYVWGRFAPSDLTGALGFEIDLLGEEPSSAP